MGTIPGNLFLSDATSYKQVFMIWIEAAICDVDFLPDSTQLVCTGPSGTAIIGDITTPKKVGMLDCRRSEVITAKYSPWGD